MCSPLQSHWSASAPEYVPVLSRVEPLVRRPVGPGGGREFLSAPVMGKHRQWGKWPSPEPVPGTVPTCGRASAAVSSAARRCRAGQGVSLRVGHLPSPELSLLGEACASQGEAAVLWGAGEPRQVSRPRFSCVLATLPTPAGPQDLQSALSSLMPMASPLPGSYRPRARWVLRAGAQPGALTSVLSETRPHSPDVPPHCPLPLVGDGPPLS